MKLSKNLLGRLMVSLMLLTGSSLSVSAVGFFSTAAPDKLFSFGVRVGINTTNQTVGKDMFETWNVSSWGTGFTAGVVAPINFRDFFAIEPGFFYESRSGDYAYADPAVSGAQNVELGHYRLYNFVIPVLAKVRFNLTSKVVWSLDFGPYYSLRLNSTNRYLSINSGVEDEDAPFPLGKRKGSDFGFKFGSGLRLMNHFYVGVHYSAGTLNVWKDKDLGGRNKGWTFSAGWDF